AREPVTEERSRRRAVPGQDAEPEADDGRDDDRPDALPQLAQRLDDVLETDLGGEALDKADALLLRGREDLAHSEEPDRDRDEADARQDLDPAEREARRSGDRVEADR